jgi:hypothetical protein
MSIDKYGGMNNASAYIGLIPERKFGVVILGKPRLHGGD